MKGGISHEQLRSMEYSAVVLYANLKQRHIESINKVLTLCAEFEIIRILKNSARIRYFRTCLELLRGLQGMTSQCTFLHKHLKLFLRPLKSGV